MESHGKGSEYRASEDRALAVLLVIAEDEEAREAESSSLAVAEEAAMSRDGA